MNERIKELRKVLGLSQDEFGKRLGVGKSAISYLESGRSSLTEQMIKLISKEYNVEIAWLTDGVGDIFSDSDDDVMAMIDNIMTGENAAAKRLFKAFAKLNDTVWQAISKIIDDLTDQKNEADQ